MDFIALDLARGSTLLIPNRNARVLTSRAPGGDLMDLKFDYETYQDVRHNLFLYSTPVLIIAGFFTYFCILPPTLQQVVVQVLEYVSNKEPLKGIVGTAAGVVVFGGIAFLLTEIIQVHDQWYDKYIVRWRHRYATDFILSS
jgi:hypothetical protein